jgi:hypothetical protein
MSLMGWFKDIFCFIITISGLLKSGLISGMAFDGGGGTTVLLKNYKSLMDLF